MYVLVECLPLSTRLICGQHNDGATWLKPTDDSRAGQGKGHILSGLKEGDTWLEFGVQFKGEEGKHWVREKWMDCNGLVCSCSIFHE